MKHWTVAVFEGNPVERILQVGGSASWVLNPYRVRQQEYLVCARSVDGKEPKDSGFLVGKISGIIPDPNRPDDNRWVIMISEYALIDVPNVWKGWQNPVHYADLESL